MKSSPTQESTTPMYVIADSMSTTVASFSQSSVLEQMSYNKYVLVAEVLNMTILTIRTAKLVR